MIWNKIDVILAWKYAIQKSPTNLSMLERKWHISLIFFYQNLWVTLSCWFRPRKSKETFPLQYYFVVYLCWFYHSLHFSMLKTIIISLIPLCRFFSRRKSVHTYLYVLFFNLLCCFVPFLFTFFRGKSTFFLEQKLLSFLNGKNE